MLKFGNTHLIFGGTYLTGWDYHKTPALENGWCELYNINPYKEFNTDPMNGLLYKTSFGMNKAYIMSAWEGDTPKAFTTYTDDYGNPISTIIQANLYPSGRYEDKVHIGDKDFTYLLYKFQVAPHSVGGADVFNR